MFGLQPRPVVGRGARRTALRDPDSRLRPLAVAAAGSAASRPREALPPATARRDPSTASRRPRPRVAAALRARRLRRRRRQSTTSAAAATVDVTLTDAGCDPADAERSGRARRPSRSTNDGADAVTRVRDPGRRPHARRGREPHARPLRSVLADARARHVHDVLPGRRRTRARPAHRHRRRRRRRPARRRPARSPRYRALPRGPDRAARHADPSAFVDALRSPATSRRRRRLYAAARVPYERIEPIAESFGDLDPAIDARADDVPGRGVDGFHRIEQALWVRRTTAGTGAIATKLRRGRDTTPRRGPDDRARARADRERGGRAARRGRRSRRSPARRSATRTSTSWTSRRTSTGEAPRSTPCADSSRAKEPALAREIDQRFADVDAALRPYRRGDGVRRVHGADEGRHAEAEPRRSTRSPSPSPRWGAIVPRDSEPTRLTRRRGCSRAGAVGARGRARRRRRRAAHGEAAAPPSTSRPVPRRPPGGHRDRRRRTAFTSPPSTSSPRSRSELRDLLRDVDGGVRAGCAAGEPVGRRPTIRLAPPVDTGEAVGLSPAHLTVTFGFGPTLFERRPLRPGERSARPRSPSCPLRRRRARPGPLRRRHRGPGVRRRPAGRVPRGAQPRPHRPWGGRDALVAARVRPHVLDQPHPGHPPQPDGFQGRHEQHQARGRPCPRAACLGAGDADPGGCGAAPTWSHAASAC